MWISDPNHHRANGNLKYFEFQLEKQRKAEAEKKEVEDKKREQKVLDKRDAQRKRSKDPLPERKKYEMLCRGEGVKLVSRKNQFFFPTFACFNFFSQILSYAFFTCRPHADKAVCFAVTMTTIAIHGCFWLQWSRKMSGTAHGLSVIMTSSLTVRSRRWRRWQNPEWVGLFEVMLWFAEF